MGEDGSFLACFSFTKTSPSSRRPFVGYVFVFSLVRKGSKKENCESRRKRVLHGKDPLI